MLRLGPFAVGSSEVRRFVYAGMAAVVCCTVVACHPRSVRLATNRVVTDTAEEWRWFVAEPLLDAWEIESGTAKVSLTDTDFQADLFLKSDLRHRISGSWTGDRLKATLSTEGSCRVALPLIGRYEKESWEDVAYSSGRETIMLFHGGMVVGLTRSIYKNENF
jgi:hypothetical protein